MDVEKQNHRPQSLGALSPTQTTNEALHSDQKKESVKTIENSPAPGEEAAP